MPLEPTLPSTAHLKLQQLRAQIDEALQTLVGDMLALSAAERDAAVSEARTAAQQEKETALDTVRRECEAAVAERVATALPQASEERSLVERLQAAEAESAAARALAATASAERDMALQQAADARDEAAEQLADARAEADKRVAEAVAAAAAEASAERALAAQALADALSDADKRFVDARLAADDRVADLRKEADRQIAEAKAEAGGMVDEARAAAAVELEQAHVGERECELACMERLVDAIRALDAAASLSATLDALADQVAAYVARVAIFVRRAGELRMWTSAGFGEEIVEAPSIDVRLDGRTVIARAAQTGERATTANGTSDAPLEPLAFASLPSDRIGLAVPLRVGGRTVAVLYADEGLTAEPMVPSAWPEVIEILARHAGACLELLTLTGAYALHAHRVDSAAQTRAAAASTPPVGFPALGPLPDVAMRPQSQAAEEDASAIRYARLLISEIKLYHEEAVTEGREEADLLARLSPEIARARRLYEERVPAEVRSRADHFGQELIRTLADGDPRLLGQVT